MGPRTWMMSWPDALRILGIWKKQLIEIQTWARPDDFVRYGHRALVVWVGVEIWAWTKIDDFWSRRGETSRGLRNVPHVVDLDGKVSIERNCVCLSLPSCRKTFKLKKVNKSFVPEPISCFSDSYMFMNIMNILWTYVYITCSYLGRSRGPIIYAPVVITRNTWNHTNCYKLFELDRNTWSLITMQKKFLRYKNKDEYSLNAIPEPLLKQLPSIGMICQSTINKLTPAEVKSFEGRSWFIVNCPGDVIIDIDRRFASGGNYLFLLYKVGRDFRKMNDIRNTLSKTGLPKLFTSRFPCNQILFVFTPK